MVEDLIFVKNTWEKLKSFYRENLAAIEGNRQDKKEAQARAEKINALYDHMLEGTGRQKLPIKEAPVIRELIAQVNADTAALRELQQVFAGSDEGTNAFYNSMLKDDYNALNDLAGRQGNVRASYIILLKRTAEGSIDAGELTNRLNAIKELPPIMGMDQSDYEVLPCAARELEILRGVRELETFKGKDFSSTLSHKIGELNKFTGDLREMAANSQNPGIKAEFETKAAELERERQKLEKDLGDWKYGVISKKADRRSGVVLTAVTMAVMLILGIGFGSLFPTGGAYSSGYVTDSEMLIYRYIPLPITRVKGFGRVYLGFGTLYYDGIKGGLPVFAPFARSVEAELPGGDGSSRGVGCHALVDKKLDSMEELILKPKLDLIRVDLPNLRRLEIRKPAGHVAIKGESLETLEIAEGADMITVNSCPLLKELVIPPGTKKVSLEHCENLEHVEIDPDTELSLTGMPHLTDENGEEIEGAVVRTR